MAAKGQRYKDKLVQKDLTAAKKTLGNLIVKADSSGDNNNELILEAKADLVPLKGWGCCREK